MDALAIFEMAYDTTLRMGRIVNYARAMTAAVRRTYDGESRVFEIDGLRFVHRRDVVIPTDYTRGCQHTLIFQLDGTGKLYRMMIEPVEETHQ
jgi:hypothetical protein